MSRVCDLCGKGYMKGNQVPRGIGKRVTRRTIIRQKPNLRVKRMELHGVRARVRVCTSCLSKLNKQSAKSATE